MSLLSMQVAVTMYKELVSVLLLVSFVLGSPQTFQTKNFKVGIEYDNSLPMRGGSDRYRHRNNYDPFFVTVTASAKQGYVISYLEVTTTVNISGEVDFEVIRGETGSRNMIFQLVSNNSEFLAYSYLAYGIREEEYKKVANIITLPKNKSNWTQYNSFVIFLISLLNLL